MAFTQTDLDTIRAAIASGVMRVRFADGREVYYQTMAGLIEAETRVAAAVARANGVRRCHHPAYRNGY